MTVNIRHCMRMNKFLSEADLVSINICFNLKLQINMKIIKEIHWNLDTKVEDPINTMSRSWRCSKSVAF